MVVINAIKKRNPHARTKKRGSEHKTKLTKAGFDSNVILDMSIHHIITLPMHHIIMHLQMPVLPTCCNLSPDAGLYTFFHLLTNFHKPSDATTSYNFRCMNLKNMFLYASVQV